MVCYSYFFRNCLPVAQKGHQWILKHTETKFMLFSFCGPFANKVYVHLHVMELTYHVIRRIAPSSHTGWNYYNFNRLGLYTDLVSGQWSQLRAFLKCVFLANRICLTKTTGDSYCNLFFVPAMLLGDTHHWSSLTFILRSSWGSHDFVESCKILPVVNMFSGWCFLLRAEEEWYCSYYIAFCVLFEGVVICHLFPEVVRPWKTHHFKTCEPRKKLSYFALYWMVNRDPCNG